MPSDFPDSTATHEEVLELFKLSTVQGIANELGVVLPAEMRLVQNLAHAVVLVRFMLKEGGAKVEALRALLESGTKGSITVPTHCPAATSAGSCAGCS